ncbi:hypothetical protein N2152v2_011253 [Parachlorella kessleri]
MRSSIPSLRVSAGLDVVAFTFILDDLVYPDGATLMGQPGGGGPQTLFGYQLYAGQQAAVGLAAGIWRTRPSQQQARMLRPPLDTLPPAFQAAKSYHVAVNPEQPGLEQLLQLRHAAKAGLLSLETFTAASQPLTAQQLQQLASLCDIFSPNEVEALSMLRQAGKAGAGRQHSSSKCRNDSSSIDAGRDGALLQLSQPFLEAGARVVAIRRGAEGAVVHRHEAGAWEVPAFPGTQVVDTTGCGNAFCGALLAALAAGEPLDVAGAWGCVAGSLMAEHLGVPKVTPAALHAEAVTRLHQMLPLVRPLGNKGP